MLPAMIPPITANLIADAIETKNMVAAGYAYWQQGRVSNLAIDAELALITASVRGSARHPYEVIITFFDDFGDAEQPAIECTCPVRFDCKHGAAVLFAAQASIDARGYGPSASAQPRIVPNASSVPPPMPASLQQWLSETQAEATRRARGTCDLVYVFSPRALHAGKSRKGRAPISERPVPHRLAIAVWTRGQRGSGPPEWKQTGVYQLRNGQMPLDPVDQGLVRRMDFYGGDFDTNGSPIGPAGGDWIDRAIATGRARWRKVDGPTVHRGDEQTAHWCWLRLANGEQRLTLEGPAAGQVLLATAPPIVVDDATGTVHHMAGVTDVALAQRLLLMPPVPPGAIAELASHWESIAGVDIPAPTLAGLQDLGAMQPVPVLTFVQDKVNAMTPHRRGYQSSPTYAPTYKADMACARLSFDYAGYRVTPSADSAVIISNSEAGFIRFRRDLAAETAALDQMFAHGLIPLDAFPELKTKPAQQWDFAPCALASATDFAVFMHGALPMLRNAGWRIEYGPGWQLTIAQVGAGDVHFDVTTSGTDWFDISLGARVDGQVVDILPMLRQLLAHVGPELLDHTGDSFTIAIGHGKLAQVPAEQIKPVLAMLLDLALHDRQASGTLRLGTGDIAVLAELEQASAAQIGWRGSEDLRRLARALARIDLQPTATPPGFMAQLRPYQQHGLDWLQALHSAGFGGVLADDMGLGKTVQALAHIATLKSAGKLDNPALIICPTSVLPNWQAEIARFVPELRCVLWHGNDRHTLQDRLEHADIIVSSYPLLLRDTAQLAARTLSLILFDEAQTLKNPRTAGFKAAKTLKAAQIVALSGTPVENQLTDLWSLMDLVTPGLLGPLDQFKRTLERPITRDDDPAAKALFRRRLRPFMLRRTKDEVAGDLPDKSEIEEWVDLEANQLAAYESLRLLMQKRVRDEIARVGLLRSQIVLLDALLKLRQLCCDPRLLPQTNGKATHKTAGSAKLARLMEMLPELLREGRQIILFSQFTAMLDLIKPELDAIGLRYVEIRGETQDRSTPVRQFQAGDVPLILISLKAGGTGLNLTAADTVILYDPWWNPAVEAQAIDRAHRIGQTRPVFVHRLIAKGTIEEKILGLQDKKRALAAMLWEGDSATEAKLTEADIAYLIG
jgi:superfamily II DNA or RNA helicase